MGNNSNYNDSSIRSLKGADQVRLRPAVIFGTNDEYGCAHGIFEIIANAIDEAREGYGKNIKISIFKDGSIEVEDNGRGVPMGWNEAEKKYNWELIFCTLYASGKYDGANYGNSLGLNGLGATAMQYASEYMDVYSTREGKTSVMHFKKGNPVGKLEVVNAIKEGTGTTIKFKPDSEVFVGIKQSALPVEYYINILRRQAMLLAGLQIDLFHEEVGKTISLKYDEGICGFIKAICEKPMISKPLVFEEYKDGTDDPELYPELYRFNMKLAITFSRETTLLEMYHNGSHLFEGGSTMDALKFGVTHAFEDHAKDIGKLNKSDKLQFRDIECIMVAVGDSSAPGHRTFFKNQTKSAINNKFMRDSFAEFTYFNIRTWLKNDKQGEAVLSEVIANKIAREEADKVSKKVVQNLSKGINGFTNKPKKFVDCKTKNVFDRELFIVEGDSALGSCKLSRDAEFQAIMPVRGKIMNCMKEELTTILNSQIIIDLLRVLGCGIEVESKRVEGLPKFDIDKLNWGKIIICTDADIDGMQIRCLIIGMLYKMIPSVIKEGKVFIAETPLFEMTHKGETYFAYTEEEKTAITNRILADGGKESQIKVQRSKGLGENDPEMMSVSTMAPETRRLIPVEYPEDDSHVAAIFSALLGDDIETRRLLINEYFKYTKADID